LHSSTTTISSSPTPQLMAAADPVVDFLEKQRALQFLYAVSEAESAARLAVAKKQHQLFVHLAQHFVNLLHRDAEAAHAATAGLAWARPPHVPVVQHRARSPPVSPRREQNRTVVCPAGNTGGATLMTTVALTGSPQRHRLDVADRRILHEAADMELRTSTFSKNEERRRGAFLRRATTLVSAGAQEPRHGTDSVAQQSKKERAQQVLRDAVRRKHAAMDQRLELEKLRKIAAADSLRKLDHLTAQSIAHASAKLCEHDRTEAIATEAAVTGSTDFRQRVNDTASLVKQKRSRTKKDFARVFQSENDKSSRLMKRNEHDAAVAHAQQMRESLAVEVSWPKGVAAMPAARPKSATIGRQSYARLCGFKQSLLQPTDAVSVAEVAKMHRVPPAAWAVLHSIDPHASYLTMQAAQSAVNRGPQHVQWRS
jgi:hypothetical protein